MFFFVLNDCCKCKSVNTPQTENEQLGGEKEYYTEGQQKVGAIKSPFVSIIQEKPNRNKKKDGDLR